MTEESNFLALAQKDSALQTQVKEIWKEKKNQEKIVWKDFHLFETKL